MQTIVFLDLDDTIFQTLPKCPPGEEVTPAACGRDGAPLSYMTKQQRHFFQWLNETTTLIPTTGRNLDAFRRVELPFRGPAILNFGGVVLDEQGQLDKEWDREMRPCANATAKKLENILAEVETFANKVGLGVRARLIADFAMPFYVVVKHPAAQLSALEIIRDQLLPALNLDDFLVHHNHNNLSIMPRFLGKEKAVSFVLDRYFAGQNVLTLGVGDSLTDIPYLLKCDVSMTPRGSQVATLRHSALTHRNAEG